MPGDKGNQVMKFISTLGLFVLSLTTSFALAAEWTPRLLCDNGGLVVDGLHSFENGFTEHQVVVRNQNVVDYFQSIVHIPISMSATQEVVREVRIEAGAQFAGSFQAELASKRYSKPGPGSGQIFRLVGHWLEDGRFEVYVTRTSCFPGGCNPSNPQYVGKWIFSDCKMVN